MNVNLKCVPTRPKQNGFGKDSSFHGSLLVTPWELSLSLTTSPSSGRENMSSSSWSGIFRCVPDVSPLPPGCVFCVSLGNCFLMLFPLVFSEASLCLPCPQLGPGYALRSLLAQSLFLGQFPQRGSLMRGCEGLKPPVFLDQRTGYSLARWCRW